MRTRPVKIKSGLVAASTLGLALASGFMIDTALAQRGARNEDAIYRAATATRDAKMAKLSTVTDATLANPPESDWLVWRRTYEGLGYSPLAQINKRNVGNLSVAWSWPLPISGNEITPLIHDGIMYISSANKVFALDAATGDQVWQYTRQLPEGYSVSRQTKNMAIYEDRVFVATGDRHMVALDMRSGKVVWDTELVPAGAAGVNVTGGPIVVRGKVIIGVTSCNTFKGGCYIMALDSKTGAEAWRFYTIARPGEPGGDTWNGAPLDERFGGAIWTSGSYDPELNLLYYGLGQTYNAATLLTPRQGQTTVGPNDALYTAATVALNPDTGKLVWHYQHFNRDVWDMDWVFERSLMTLPVNGVNRKVVVTAGKLAIFDALDRTTGQYLFSKDVGLQNLVSSIDPVTGKKTVDPQFAQPEANVPKSICPHAGGARSWPSTAYNPKSGIMYIPLVESCMDFTWRLRSPTETAAGGSDIGWVLKPRPDTDGNFGRVDAIDMKTKKTLWSQRRRAPEISALLATGGGLVFAGSRDRQFRAMDESTGKTLWETKLSTVPSSFPITYSVGGKQYVAVVSGGGGAHEATWPTLTPEIENPAGSTSVWVFALPGNK